MTLDKATTMVASSLMKLIYNAAIEDFPGAPFLIEGCLAFLAFLATMGLYWVVWKHEKRYGPIGKDQEIKEG